MVGTQGMDQGGGYAFAQQPRAVSGRSKYRDPSTADDRLAVSVPDPGQTQRDSTRRSRLSSSSGRGTKRGPSSFPHSSLGEDATAGRKHIEVKTENFLEEITDRPIEIEVDTQTDPFMDRPPSPLFIPAKTGVDRETQILEGDLFNFDSEVEPILQVLVGKTLEQSLMEVLEEEELANMRAHQEEFDQVARAELAEAQRMEEAEKRRHFEKERRMAQERERIAAEKEVALKVASRSFSHRYVADIVSDVFGTLNDNGFFYDPLTREIETVFTPWLLEGVASNALAIVRAQELIQSTVENAVKLQEERKKEAQEAYNAAVARKEEEQRAAQAATLEAASSPSPEPAPA